MLSQPIACSPFLSLNLAPTSEFSSYNLRAMVSGEIRDSSTGWRKILPLPERDLSIAISWVCQVQRRLLCARIRDTRASGVSEVPGTERLQVCAGATGAEKLWDI